MIRPARISARTTAVSLVALLVLVTGCGGLSITFGEDIEATGDLISTTFDVEEFDALDVQSTFEVFVIVGESQSVEVLTNEDLIDQLDIRVRNGELNVGLKDGVSIRRGTLEATITVPDLAKVEVSGASVTEIGGLDRVDLSIDVSGASELLVEGRATSVSVEASGASTIELRLADVSDVRIDLSGATSLDLLSTDRVTGEMSGASSLTLPDEADLDIQASGASDITGR